MTPAEKLAARKLRKDSAQPRKVVLICRVRAARQKLRLSLRDVERETGVHNVTLCDAERGCNITLTNALRLAKFFGVSVESLWTEARS